LNWRIFSIDVYVNNLTIIELVSQYFSADFYNASEAMKKCVAPFYERLFATNCSEIQALIERGYTLF